MTNPYDLALENYSLRIERDYGHPLTFREGATEDGAAWCESFFRGCLIDRAVAAPRWENDAKCLIMAQPIQRIIYAQLSNAR